MKFTNKEGLMPKPKELQEISPIEILLSFVYNYQKVCVGIIYSVF